MFWAFKIKLQIIHAATYIAPFVPASNSCFFIFLLLYIPICLYYFLIFCFYFHLHFHSLVATRHILQFTMFDLISLQPALNTPRQEILHSPLPKKKCHDSDSQTNALIFSRKNILVLTLLLIKLNSF